MSKVVYNLLDRQTDRQTDRGSLFLFVRETTKSSHLTVGKLCPCVRWLFALGGVPDG